MRKIKIEQEVDIEEMIKQMRSIDFDAVSKCIMETAISVVNKLVEIYEDVCNSELMKVEEPKPTCYCSGRITELKCTEKCKHYYDCEINKQYRTIQEYDFNARKEINSIKCFGNHKYNDECLPNTCILYDLCKKTTKEIKEAKKKNKRPYCFGVEYEETKEKCKTCEYAFGCYLKKPKTEADMTKEQSNEQKNN